LRLFAGGLWKKVDAGFSLRENRQWFYWKTTADFLNEIIQIRAG
jgi:hypothetical protein